VSDSGNTQASGWNAGLYDDKFSFIWEYGSNLIDLLDPRPGERILDIGCGTGHLTQTIAQRGADVVGTDYSASMIEQARANYPGIRFEVEDASNFTVDQPFDAIFSNAVLHWVRDAEGAVASMSAALKPGGRLVAEFGGKGNVRQIVDTTLAVLNEMGYTNRDASNPWYFPSIGEYTGLLERHGFETRSALLFDRPTRLDGGDSGLALWLEMFGDSFFAGISADERERIVAAVVDRLRHTLFRDGNWYADYVRLRVLALKR